MDTTQATYLNANQLALALKELGYLGIRELDIFGLEAFDTATINSDRVVHFIQGNAIILPRALTGPPDYYKQYNTDFKFGLSFNSDGSDSDEWLDFYTSATEDRYLVQELFFYKFWVRNITNINFPTDEPLRLYIVQNPFWIQQLNKLLKDEIQ